MGIEELSKQVNDNLNVKDKKLVVKIISETFSEILKSVLEGKKVNIKDIGAIYVDINKARKPYIGLHNTLVETPAMWAPKIKWFSAIRDGAKKKPVYDGSTEN